MTYIPYIYYLNLTRGPAFRQVICQYKETATRKRQKRHKIGGIIPSETNNFRNKEEFIQGIFKISENDFSEAFKSLGKRLKNKSAFINSCSSIADIIFYELFPGWKETYMLWSGDIRNGDLKAHITAKQVLIYEDIFRFALKHAQTEKRRGWKKWRQEVFIQYLEETESINTDMILAMEGRLNAQSHVDLMEYEKSFIETWQRLELQKVCSFSVVDRPAKSKFKDIPWSDFKISHSWEE